MMSRTNQTIRKVNRNSGAGSYPLDEQTQDANVGVVTGDRMMYANRYKHLILAAIALVIALVISAISNNSVALAQASGEIEPKCGGLSVDLLNQNELEPMDPARFNRGKVLPQGRDLDSPDHPVRPEWEESTPPCPQWEELEVLSS